jgi:hypothetical protein
VTDDYRRRHPGMTDSDCKKAVEGLLLAFDGVQDDE